MKITRIIKRLLTTLQLISFLVLATTSHAFEILDEQQLDNISAGGQVSNNDDIIASIPFHYEGRHGIVDGEAIVMPGYSNQTSGSLMIQDGAQSHLSSMININAVNSPIQVLLNLNVNINSQIDSINQYNIGSDLRW